MRGFTDDTICTIAVADAILKGVDYGVSIHKWCRKYPRSYGVGTVVDLGNGC